jgi:hypothetical protein
MEYGLLFLIAFIVCILWIMHRRKRSAVKAERAVMFNDCTDLFEKYRIVQDDIYYPVLDGRYRGHDFRLEPIADHIAFRTIPSLWLLVTLRKRIPYEGIFDFLVRQRNVEFYSPSSKLRIDIDIPEGWPQHAVLRTNNPEGMPPRERLEPHIAFFDDPKAKELLVTPKGVRVVYQARQAERSYYMLLRQVVFEDINLSADLVRELMDRCIAVYRGLVEEKH